MASAITSFEKPTRIEDILEHLPISITTQCRKGQVSTVRIVPPGAFTWWLPAPWPSRR